MSDDRSTNQVDAGTPPPAPEQTAPPVTPLPQTGGAVTPQQDMQGQGSPQPNQPQVTQNQPTAQPAGVKPHPVSRAFDGILKTISGGPIVVTDPQTGERREVQQTKGQMGRAIVAAALAGLFTPPSYRQTPYGPAPDTGANIANAGRAGMAMTEARQERAQKLTDDQQSRKLMTLQNNAKLVQLQAASAHSKHEMLTDQNANAQAFLSPFNEYDKLRTSSNDPSQPNAYLAQNLSSDEILKGGHQLTDSNIVMDGVRQVYNPETKQSEEEPTYAVLNPALGDVTLSKQVTDKLNEVNSQWKDIHSVVGGTVRVPVNAYVSAMHDYQAVTQGENLLNTLSQEINGDKAKKVDLAGAVRSNRALLPVLYSMTQAVAGGNTPDARPDNVLDTILKAPNGTDLLKLLGLTPKEAADKVEEINNDRKREQVLAAQGGIGEKSPASQAQVDSVLAVIDKMPPEDRNVLRAGINPKGMTVGELEKLNNKVLSTVQQNKTSEAQRLRDGGDPILNQKVASNIVEGDVSRLNNLPPRGQARENVMSLIHDEAERRGLDTTQYSAAALDNKANTFNDYGGNKKGSTGAQIGSFNAFLGHTAGAIDAGKRLAGKTLGSTGLPWLNVPLDVLGKQVTDDPDWKAYKTSLIPVQQEIQNFLAAGYAVKSEDQTLMNDILNPHETPTRINAALKQLAETADIRLAAMGQRYVDTMGTTYPALLSTDSKNTLNRLGIKSKSIPLSQKLPRGWKGSQASPMPPNMVNQFLQAAGGDPKAATELAKQNGWK